MRQYRVQIHEQRWQMWGAPVLWALGGYYTLIAPGVTPTRLLVYLGVGLGATLLAYRLYRAGIVATDDGVEVRRAFRDVRLGWDEIDDGFSDGLSFFGPVVQIQLDSGKRIRSIGTAAGSPVGGDESLEDLRSALVVLNRLNEEHTQGPG